MANTSWLQITGRTPRAFKTKGAASAELKVELARAEAKGWAKLWGSTTRGCVAVGKGDKKVALVVSTVDADGVEVGGAGRTCKPEYR
jgi:hypothetical protein